MLYALLLGFLTIVFLTVFTSYFVMREAVPDRSIRKLLLLTIVLTPPLGVWAFFKSLFVNVKPLGYSEELAGIEDSIEDERVETFGGKKLDPSFSHKWKASYLYALQKAAMRVDPPMASYFTPPRVSVNR